jgi:YHS domain-containing protein
MIEPGGPPADPADGPPPTAEAIDPVCGMAVAPAVARARGLHRLYRGVDYFFCGRGCKLDFDDDPEEYLDPGYVPGM